MLPGYSTPAWTRSDQLWFVVSSYDGRINVVQRKYDEAVIACLRAGKSAVDAKKEADFLYGEEIAYLREQREARRKESLAARIEEAGYQSDKKWWEFWR